MSAGPGPLHLSVVIPTHHGSRRIAPLLRALAAQSLDPSRMDVLVVDNGSTDGSAARIAADPAFRQVSEICRARVVALDRPGLTNARVEGVRASSGDVVLFLDDDAEPERECCAEALAPFGDERVGVVFGRVFPKYATPPHPAIRKREGILAINHRLGDAPLVWKRERDFAPTLGVALAVRRAAFLQAYPWSEPDRLLPDRVGARMLSGGDVEIGQYLARAGWWRAYNPRMPIHHAIDPARLEVRPFVRLIVGIERSRATFERKFSLGPPPFVRRLKAACDALAIAALAPWWMLTHDGPRGWYFALASRAGRLAGAYSDRPQMPEATLPAGAQRANTRLDVPHAGGCGSGRLRARFTPGSRIKYLTWRARGSAKPLTVRLSGGPALILRPPPATDLDNAYEVFVGRYYERPAGPRAPARAVKSVVDLGAYVGYSTLFFLHRHPEARVTAVEPSPEHLSCLRRQLELNGWSARVRIIEAAAGARPRAAHLKGDGIFARLESSADAGQPVRVLDAFEWLASGVDLLKVDIEGAEWEILGDPRFATLAVPLVAIEWHQERCPEPDGRAACIARFAAAGYSLAAEPYRDPHMGVLWFFKR